MNSEPSLVYRSPLLYRLAMQILYYPYFEARYQSVSRLVPDGATVVDVCCGDAYIYSRYLRHRDVKYIGLDNSAPIVRAGRNAGIDVRLFDMRRDTLPSAQYLLMHGSFFQFQPELRETLQRLLAAASVAVIVAEPIRNLASSPNPLVRKLALLLTRPSGRSTGYTGSRFDEESFRKFTDSIPELEHRFLIPGGREAVAVFRGLAGLHDSLDPQVVNS